MSPPIHYQQPPLAKVLVIGESETGKTSLVNRFVFHDFLAVEPTVGVNFAQKVMTGRDGPLNLSIWDLSGQALPLPNAPILRWCCRSSLGFRPF